MNIVIVYIALQTFLLSDIIPAGSGNAGKELFPDIGGWNLTVSDRVYTPDDLWDIIDGAAGAYLSYDFIDLNLAEYQQGEDIVHVELYRHSTPENTFGIYASERNTDYSFIDIGTEGYCSEGILNFLAGFYYVKIYSVSKSKEIGSAIRQIAGEIVKALGQEHRWPAELQLFPGRNKIERSEQYISRNFMGFDFLGSAFTAEYSDNGTFRLFIIHGKQQDDLKAMLGKYLAFTGQTIDPLPSGPFLIKDPYNGDIKAMIIQDYLFGVVGCRDQEAGVKYLELVKSKLSGQ
jgi:hypothetical protein